MQRTTKKDQLIIHTPHVSQHVHAYIAACTYMELTWKAVTDLYAWGVKDLRREVIQVEEARGVMVFLDGRTHLSSSTAKRKVTQQVKQMSQHLYGRVGVVF